MEKNNVYCLGSINIDLTISTHRIPARGETLKGYDFVINSGGKGANQAYSAAKLGANVYMVAQVGNDEFKETALNSLKAANINVSYVKIYENINTGVAMIIKNDKDNRIIFDAGANDLITKKHIDESLSNAQQNDIFMTQYEINKDAVLYGLQEAKKKKMITLFNPAPANLISNEMYKLVDYLIVNQTEAELLTGLYPKNKNDVNQIFEILKEKGANNIIVTLGDKGATMLIDKVYHVDAHNIEVVDTIGAGDSFIGALAYGIINKFDNDKLLRFANATSAVVCQTAGAQTAMPNADMVNNFLKGGKS